MASFPTPLVLFGLLCWLGPQAAKARGASRIFAIDINESKFELARQLGATDCLNPTKSDMPIQQVSLTTLGLVTPVFSWLLILILIPILILILGIMSPPPRERGDLHVRVAMSIMRRCVVNYRAVGEVL